MSVSPIDSDFPSPSLASSTDRSRQAYELKFLVNDNLAAQIQAWARARMSPDPHGDPALDGAYQTTTLYLDTPQLDVYHRSPGYRCRKFRVRRYGLTTWVSLERKTKRGDRLSKRRFMLPEGELAQLANPMSLETWPGHWFHQRILARHLQPACLVSYLRTAWVGTCSEGPMRLTVDHQIRGLLASEWRLAPFDGGLPLLTPAPAPAPASVVMELKFLDALPRPFKQLLQDFRLTPMIVSKYRACREAWGVNTGGIKSIESPCKSVQSA